MHSIVLLAACNAHYEFTLVDIGGTGRQADGDMYASSYLGRAIQNELLNVPEPDCLQNNPNITMSYALSGR